MSTNEPAGIDLDQKVIERAIRFIESGSHTVIARDTMANELRNILARRASAPVADERALSVIARDWPEDAGHENGNYQCICSTCGNTFFGYKRRITCKGCAALAQQSPAPVVAHDAPEAPASAQPNRGAAQYEITRDMIRAGMPHFHDKRDPATKALECYKDMRAAAPASAQPDRGAAQFDHAKFMQMVREFAEVCYGVRRSTEDVGKNLIDYVKSLAAPSPASQPIAPETTQAEDIQYLKNVAGDAVPMLSAQWPKTATLLKDAVEKVAAHADDALRKAAIYTNGAWHVPMHMITSAHAQQEAAPTSDQHAGVRKLLQEFVDYYSKPAGLTLDVAMDTDRLGEFLKSTEAREKDMVARAKALLTAYAAVAPSDAKDATVPDHSEREAANAGGLTVWEGPMPESNGKSNFTAVLHRKDSESLDIFTDGFQFARSEYPDRVRYEADFMRWLIGERDSRPELWDACYDMDKHSGYVSAPATIAAGQKAANAKDAARVQVRDAVAQALDGIYYCGRVWSAWQVGTMSEDDFTPAAEVDDVLDEITDAAMAAVSAAGQEAANAKDAARGRWLIEQGFKHANVDLTSDSDGDPVVIFHPRFYIPEPAGMSYEDGEWTIDDIREAIDAAMAAAPSSEKGGA